MWVINDKSTSSFHAVLDAGFTLVDYCLAFQIHTIDARRLPVGPEVRCRNTSAKGLSRGFVGKVQGGNGRGHTGGNLLPVGGRGEEAVVV
jgi:hypothetical protein